MGSVRRINKDSIISNYDQNSRPRHPADRAVAVDAGLRAYMLRVYNYMAIGVGLTGLVAMLTYQLAGPSKSADVGVHAGAASAGVFYWRTHQHAVGGSGAPVIFRLSALVGLSLSAIFPVYTESSITRVFFISATTFGALSLWGYAIRSDLSGFGTYLFMGVIGIVISSLVNLFFRSSGLDWIISVVGVGVFAGLTAYDTQRIKGMYDRSDHAVSMGRNALSLYLNFINLFVMLLRLAGHRR
jgi:FtsH-binding integral membrane protein